MKIGFLYAGQGSQAVGMGKDFYEKYDVFKRIFDLLPMEKREIAFNGPIEELSDTRNTQSIMVAFAIGVTQLLKNEGISPAVVAGLSLGEYSALQCSGFFTEEQALDIIGVRSGAMYDAAKNISSKMAAILGLDRDKLAECCRLAGGFNKVEISNYNCPGQIVIGGIDKNVDKAAELALEMGAKRAVPLATSGPFHTSIMETASKTLEDTFDMETFGHLNIPVIFNVTGNLISQGEKVPELLVQQVKRSVQFEKTIYTLLESGVTDIVEIGPGKALSAFVKKTLGQESMAKYKDVVKLHNIIDCQSLEKTIEELREDR